VLASWEEGATMCHGRALLEHLGRVGPLGGRGARAAGGELAHLLDLLRVHLALEVLLLVRLVARDAQAAEGGDEREVEGGVLAHRLGERH
jgi:hypothetical protein